ncbi:unnamed protein product [Staurois parvus]|uniref:Uncharacterized protein n=1 Tax=Staurois parvus TaxID=386267 RepID=A0ABN9FAN0_9NEOB|nr:unnamed protein product [Staurois parvus]
MISAPIISVAPSMPHTSAQQFHISLPTSAHQSCQSVPPISASQCRLKFPISAT